MSKRLGWLLVGLVVLVAGAGAVFDRVESSAAPAAEPQARADRPATAVEVTQAATETVIEDIRAVGTLRPDESVVIAPEISGRIAAIRFREGEAVKAGDVLVQLDSDILQAEVAKARSDVTLTAANRERADTLARQGTGTLRARDEAQAAHAVAQSELILAEARLRKATITAPLSGTVGLRSVSAGAYVTPGERIVELAAIDPLKVDFRVPELDVASLRTGQTILITADAVPDRTVEGKVYAIDPVVDIDGRAIRLRATVPNPDNRLSAGFFVRIRIVVDRRENAVVVPESAVFPLFGKTLVYRIVDGRAKETEVVLGQRLTGRVEVREGLSPGDTVVTAGQQRLRDGATVEIVNAAPGA
ncbi:MAG: efflux RND transporter periplasmic adaptor subunit [Acetobacterales bacterium]